MKEGLGFQCSLVTHISLTYLTLLIPAKVYLVITLWSECTVVIIFHSFPLLSKPQALEVWPLNTP